MTTPRYIPPPPNYPPTVPAAIPPDEDDQDEEPREEPEKARPWWYVKAAPFAPHRAPDPDAAPQAPTTVAPGVHVTVNQGPPAPTLDPAAVQASERLHRRRLWVAYHAGAAATGWLLGLAQQMGDAIAAAGHHGAGIGVGFLLITYICASYLPGLPYIPPALRPVIVWAARIPVCSAALALALYAPGTF